MTVPDPQSLVAAPSELMSAEYKEWLDLERPEHQGLLVRATIALANSGGGFVVIGFKSGQHGALVPCDSEAPNDVRLTYAQERIQRLLAKYAEPSFEVQCLYIERPGTGIVHPVIRVPTDVRDAVVVAKSSPEERPLRRGALYMRRPGPESSPPQTSHDWRNLIDGLIDRKTRKTGPESGAPVSEGQESVPDAPRTVRDRMSNLPPPSKRTGTESPSIEMDSSDRFVLERPISEVRVDALGRQIRDQLMTSMPSFVLTEIAGVRHRLSAYDPALRFGFSLMSFKGPFVEGSNWAEMREREFALSLDRYLLKQFGELLAERSATAPIVPLEADAIRTFVRQAQQDLEESGGRPDLLVILDAPTADRVERVLLDDHRWWSAPRTLRGTALHDVVYVHGALEGLPALQIFEVGGLAEPRLCIVDLDDFELLLTNVSEDLDDYLEFEVRGIAKAEAENRIAANPAWRERMFRGKHQTDGAFTHAEAVVHLQLMADYSLMAAGEFREQNVPRTRSARVTNAAS